jgi:DNA-binding NarL/FixJ family response regulator
MTLEVRVHRKTRHAVGKSRSGKLSAEGSALDRVRNGMLRRKRPTVCILSNHPVVLEQLHDAIDKNCFSVFWERLKPFSQSRDDVFVLPRSPLCVLDALGPKPATAAVVQQILQAYPDACILLVADKDAEGDCFDLLLLGARGLLSYKEAPEHLTEALKCVADGGFWLSPLRLSRFIDSFLGRCHSKQPAVTSLSLSRRENEILERLFQDFSNKEIANELNISERTVKFHVSNLLQKFGVHGRRELILSFGPLASTGLLGGYYRQELVERGNLAGHPRGKSRFLPARKDEEEILSGAHTPRPAYSVS